MLSCKMFLELDEKQYDEFLLLVFNVAQGERRKMLIRDDCLQCTKFIDAVLDVVTRCYARCVLMMPY